MFPSMEMKRGLFEFYLRGNMILIFLIFYGSFKNCTRIYFEILIWIEGQPFEFFEKERFFSNIERPAHELNENSYLRGDLILLIKMNQLIDALKIFELKI